MSLPFLIRRILAVIPVMFAVVLFVFLLLRLAPGDTAAIVAGDSATPEQLDAIRRSLGLDRSMVSQFGAWLEQLAKGDLGISLISGQPVAGLIAQRIAPTLWLTFLTMVVSTLIAIPLGVIAAWAYRGLSDRVITLFCVLAFSIPVFVIGYVLMLVFAIDLDWLPVQGYRSPSSGLGAFLSHMILPVMALSIPLAALIARVTRASMLDVLQQDYIRTARAKGLPEKTVLFRHALQTAAPPILTVIGNSIALLISGAIVTESVFNIPGLGRLVVDSVLARDYPVIQGVIILTSAAYVLLNLAIDLAYTILDPRVQYE